MCIFRCFRRHALIVIAAQFRRQHEQLSSVIAKVLKVSGRNAGENEGIIDTADKDAIEAAIVELKAVLDSGDATQIKAKSDALAQVSMKLGEQLYKNQQEAGAAAGGGTAAEEPGVVDAEFSEVKDDKKSGAA